LNWTQYTPYFNDGDTCEFRFNSLRVKLKPEYIKDKEKYEEYEEGFEVTDLGYYAKEANIIKTPFVNIQEGLSEDLETLEDILNESEDELKDVFGDHAEIIVTPEKLEVTEYDHE
jgi:hypothetical protein